MSLDYEFPNDTLTRGEMEQADADRDPSECICENTPVCAVCEEPLSAKVTTTGHASHTGHASLIQLCPLCQLAIDALATRLEAATGSGYEYDDLVAQ